MCCQVNFPFQLVRTCSEKDALLVWSVLVWSVLVWIVFTSCQEGGRGLCTQVAKNKFLSDRDDAKLAVLFTSSWWRAFRCIHDGYVEK